MKRYSKQRELILRMLQERDDHPTVEMLYTDLKKEMPEIGIATVYRNLSDLCEEGMIRKIKTQNDGPDRFDGNIKPHIHFECLACHHIYDIFPEEKEYEKLNDNLKKTAKTIGADAVATNMKVYGVCKSCKK